MHWTWRPYVAQTLHGGMFIHTSAVLQNEVRADCLADSTHDHQRKMAAAFQASTIFICTEVAVGCPELIQELPVPSVYQASIQPALLGQFYASYIVIGDSLNIIPGHLNDFASIRVFLCRRAQVLQSSYRLQPGWSAVTSKLDKCQTVIPMDGMYIMADGTDKVSRWWVKEELDPSLTAHVSRISVDHSITASHDPGCAPSGQGTIVVDVGIGDLRAGISLVAPQRPPEYPVLERMAPNSIRLKQWFIF